MLLTGSYPRCPLKPCPSHYADQLQAANFRKFCETYFPNAFPLKWSADDGDQTHRTRGIVAEGDLSQAKALYDESLSISRKLVLADPTNTEAQRNLSVSLNKLGDLARTAGDLPQARVLYDESLTISRKLALADPTNAQAQRDLSISLDKLGGIAATAGDFPQARALYEESLTIRRKLALAALARVLGSADPGHGAVHSIASGTG